MILALAIVIKYNRQSDAPIWSVTSSAVNYDRNKFIIQAIGLILLCHFWIVILLFVMAYKKPHLYFKMLRL